MQAQHEGLKIAVHGRISHGLKLRIVELLNFSVEQQVYNVFGPDNINFSLSIFFNTSVVNVTMNRPNY